MTGWHLPPEALTRYADGSAGDATAASVEAHAMRCGECRDRLSALADPVRLDHTWSDVVDRIDTPRAGLLERLLRLRLPAHEARLVATAPSLRGAWLTGVVVALAFAALAATADRAALPFLLVAPLVPVAGVAAAYGGSFDTAWELSAAAPYRAARLLLLRALAVLLASVVCCTAAGLALGDGLAAAWLLPALALTGLTLALETVVRPATAAGMVAAGWALVLALAYPDPAGAAVQAGSAVVALAAAAVVAARYGHFETGAAS